MRCKPGIVAAGLGALCLWAAGVQAEPGGRVAAGAVAATAPASAPSTSTSTAPAASTAKADVGAAAAAVSAGGAASRPAPADGDRAALAAGDAGSQSPPARSRVDLADQLRRIDRQSQALRLLRDDLSGAGGGYVGSGGSYSSGGSYFYAGTAYPGTWWPVLWEPVGWAGGSWIGSGCGFGQWGGISISGAWNSGNFHLRFGTNSWRAVSRPSRP